MIQFILSISLVIFLIVEITLLRMLFSQQSKKILEEIVDSWDPMLAYHERKVQKSEVLVPNQVTNRYKDY